MPVIKDDNCHNNPQFLIFTINIIIVIAIVWVDHYTAVLQDRVYLKNSRAIEGSHIFALVILHVIGDVTTVLYLLYQLLGHEYTLQ